MQKTKTEKREMQGVVTAKDLMQFTGLSLRQSYRELNDIRETMELPKPKKVFWAHIFRYYCL